MRSALKTSWRAALLPVVVIVVAQIAATVTHLESDSLASPLDIVTAFFAVLTDGSLLRATADTVMAAFCGCVLGVGVGSLIGIVLGLFRLADDTLDLTIELLRPVPVVALIPVVMMLLGFGARMEIVIIALGLVWPSIVLARAAVREVEPRLMEVSAVLMLGFSARLTKIVLPAIVPQLFMSLKLAAGYALVVAVTVEITANPFGLGYGIMMAQQALRPAEMFAYLLWIGAIGWLISLLLNAAQGRVMPAFAKGDAR
jgi:ABC-type nitrate/sulfonate/bicarbonate transport system permease component